MWWWRLNWRFMLTSSFVSFSATTSSPVHQLTDLSVRSSGYLLADDPQSETPLIPSEVMEFSIKHSTEVDINTTLQILGSPGEKASSIPGCNRTDSVIRYHVQFHHLAGTTLEVGTAQLCAPARPHKTPPEQTSLLSEFVGRL